MKPEELKRLQAAKKQREKEKKDAETNARRHAANVRVRQRAQVHIQGMTTKIANEDVGINVLSLLALPLIICYCVIPDPPIPQRARSVRALWQDSQAFLLKTSCYPWSRRARRANAIIFIRSIRSRKRVHQLLKCHRSQCMHCCNRWLGYTRWTQAQSNMGNDTLLSCISTWCSMYKRKLHAGT